MLLGKDKQAGQSGKDVPKEHLLIASLATWRGNEQMEINSIKHTIPILTSRATELTGD